MSEASITAAARAAYESGREVGTPWEQLCDDDRRPWIVAARAAFAAVRVPSKHVLDAVFSKIPDYAPVREEAEIIWRAAIDALLEAE